MTEIVTMVEQAIETCIYHLFLARQRDAVAASPYLEYPAYWASTLGLFGGGLSRRWEQLKEEGLENIL